MITKVSGDRGLVYNICVYVCIFTWHCKAFGKKRALNAIVSSEKVLVYICMSTWYCKELVKVKGIL
jgi:hypothetical protein